MICVGMLCSQQRAASFTYFGEVSRCPHKRIVTTTKVYIARNNIHVEILRFRTGVTVCACMRFACVIRSGYLVLANQHTSSEGQGSRDLRLTRVEPY